MMVDDAGPFDDDDWTPLRIATVNDPDTADMLSPYSHRVFTMEIIKSMERNDQLVPGTFIHGGNIAY